MGFWTMKPFFSVTGYFDNGHELFLWSVRRGRELLALSMHAYPSYREAEAAMGEWWSTYRAE